MDVKCEVDAVEPMFWKRSRSPIALLSRPILCHCFSLRITGVRFSRTRLKKACIVVWSRSTCALKCLGLRVECALYTGWLFLQQRLNTHARDDGLLFTCTCPLMVHAPLCINDRYKQSAAAAGAHLTPTYFPPPYSISARISHCSKLDNFLSYG